jgi:hypothetical protein
MTLVAAVCAACGGGTVDPVYPGTILPPSRATRRCEGRGAPRSR